MIVALLAAAAFAATVVLRQDASGSRPTTAGSATAARAGGAGSDTPGARNCGASAERLDAGSPIQLTTTLETRPSPPQLKGTIFRVDVRRGNAPMTGANVCLIAGMDGMSIGGVSREAREMAPGRYEMSLDFAMPGSWDGLVLVSPPGHPLVATPFSVDVGM